MSGGGLKLVGTVLKLSSAKTVAVEVLRSAVHPLYGRPYTQRTRLLVHDEKAECGVGDRVRIKECRPISRRKHFEVEERIGTSSKLNPIKV